LKGKVNWVKQNVLLHQDIKISQGYYRPSQKVSRAAVYSSDSQMAIIKTTKIGSFPLPGIEKLSPSKPHSHTERNPATGAEIKIPGKSTGEMWVAEAAGEAEEGGKEGDSCWIQMGLASRNQIKEALISGESRVAVKRNFCL
jgi:hypothetical protein